MDGDIKIVWAPQRGPQSTFFQLPDDIQEVFLAGSRGGGKTAAILARFAVQANKYGSAARGLIVRRKLTEMVELKFQAEAMFTPLGANFHVTSNSWRFPNGANLRLARLEERKDALGLQGQSYSYIAVDEAQNWPDPSLIDMMRATLRSVEGVPTLLCLTANPGGRGSAWCRSRYIDPYPAGYKVVYDQHGNKRIYIPLNVDDNRILLDRDPTYTARLLQSGPPSPGSRVALRRLVRLPDRRAVGRVQSRASSVGAVRDSRDMANLCRARLGRIEAERPLHLRLRDRHRSADALQRFFPRGSFILIDEVYTCATDDDGGKRYDVGTKLPNEALGELNAA